MTASPPAARWRLPAACAVLLLLAWGGVLDAPFVADDYAHARHALGADSVRDLVTSLTGSWHGQGPPWYYRPLAVVSFALDAALYGANPVGWHATTFALFLGAALLLAGATRAVLARLGVEGRLAARAGSIAALMACVLPSQLEAIAWISNRDGPLATVAGLAAVWLWTRDRRAWAAVASALAVCAKETGVTWLLLLGALTLLYARREQPGRVLRTALSRGVPLLFVLALYFGARLAMFGTFGIGHQGVLTDPGAKGGVPFVAGNVLDWLLLFPWPVGADLLGVASVPAGIVCAVLALSPWLLAWLDDRALPRGALGRAAAGGALAAIVLLGPIVFVAAPGDDLLNSRFVPFIALPLCAVTGLAWAAALAGRFRAPAAVLLPLLLAVHVLVASVQAGAFALVAGDLQSVRATVRARVADGTIVPARMRAPVMLLDPPARGPAAFAVQNALQDILLRPLTDVDIPMRALTRDELATARLLPEFEPVLEPGAFLLPRGEPTKPTRPFQRLAESLRRFQRLGLGALLQVRRELPASPGPPDLSAPFDALDVAALQVEGHGGQPPEMLRVAFTGTRGSGVVEFPCRQRPAIVPLEAELSWLAAGVVTSLQVSSPQGVLHGVVPLARLPAIAILEPPGALLLPGDPRAPLQVTFRPPFACERYRFRVLVELAVLADTYEAAQLPADADGAVHLRFQEGVSGGRRTTIDWRFVRAWARNVRVRWFVEGLDGEGDAARVVARSAIRDVKAE